MLAHHYAHALTDRIEAGADIAVLLEQLDRVLVKKGHTKIKRRILSHVLQVLRERSVTATVRFANADDQKSYEKAIEALCSEYGVLHELATITDPTIIGGFQFETKNIRVDRSFKRSLVELYRSIIS